MSGRAARGVIVLLLATLAISQARAVEPSAFWPGAVYDPHIPTFRQTLGYDAGERITPYAGIVRYMEALAGASRRIKIFPYGESWEGRGLIYAAIGSEANIRKLGEIRASMQRLADPRRTPEAEARAIMTDLPAVVWLAAGVHGDEVAAPEAMLMTAYHLLAARNDEMVDRILERVVVLIDPLQNPDGHERFANHYEQTRGPEPDSNPSSAEHHEPWPGGRFNHYLFDLNRDWLALTQPEIRGEVRVLREWYPLAAVDLHDMSGTGTYFFSPETNPYNPNLTSAQRDALSLFGRNNAKWFDRMGADYFTRETYDAFYPGYGASWPCYYGAVAMTYEQAAVHGLAIRRPGDSTLLLRDALRHHFVASLATLETAAVHRGKLIEDFYHYRASAVGEGSKGPVQEYILPRGLDAAATDKLAAILMEQGIEVLRAAAAFRAGDRNYPAGTYVVPMAQPANRLIRTLLDPQTTMDGEFVAAEERRRKLGKPSEIYDVTAWALPLMFNVEAVAAAARSEGSFEPASPARVAPGQMHASKAAAVAYLAPWGSEAAGRLLTAALRQDLKVWSSDKGFAQGGAKFPAGTLIFKTADNPGDLPQRLADLARETGAEVYGTDTGWVDEGVNFGSPNVLPLRKPAIAMAWDEPTAPSEAGAARFVLERQYGYPVTLVRTAQLRSADLTAIQVLILPPGGDYTQPLGESGIEALREWIAAGGTLIALGGAVEFLTDDKVGLLDIAQEEPLGAGGANSPEAPDKKARVDGSEISSEAEYEDRIRAVKDLPGSAPGAIVRARVLPDHWLTAGVPETVNVLVEGRAIYTPVKAGQGLNLVRFESAGNLLASGYLWDENRKQMASPSCF